MLHQDDRRLGRTFLLAIVLTGNAALCGAEPRFRSHAPVRPLPRSSQRERDPSPARFVHPRNGSDKNDGSRKSPWKTLAHAVKQLKPGETLYLRGGTYFETAVISVTGTADKPITVRSYPGELAVIDGGLREFFESPAAAWEPVKNGAPDEYRSVKTYPQLPKQGRHDVRVTGNFGDSMVPLHGYRFGIDFRARNIYWNIGHKLNDKRGIYVGPGVWHDLKSNRIHVRLSHLKLKSFGKDAYRGETDPRKLPLVIAGVETPLRIEKTAHLRVQDLVIRGSAGQTLAIDDSQDIRLEGLTVYGGAPAVHLRNVRRLTLVDSVVRGLSAPWSSRASHKYRGNSAYLFVVDGRGPQCRDFEIAHCEFTDSHDGLIIGTMRNLKFHHNLVENFDDDALYLTLSRARVPANLWIYQNRLNRSLTMFAFTGPRDIAVGPGVHIFRNILDFRRRTLSGPPTSADKDAVTTKDDWSRLGRPCGDHGGPTWEPMFVYHNTVICEDRVFRSYYGAGWGGHTRASRRRVFNNVFLHLKGMPGLNFSGPADDCIADGNLHWSVESGSKRAADFFTKFRTSKAFDASKKRYRPGNAAHDRYADPLFTRFSGKPGDALDLRLRPTSPAIDAGVLIPKTRPDPLRNTDRGKPDLGALPKGRKLWQVGPRSR